MPLLPSQYATLKAFIAADPVLSQAAPNEDGDDFVALELNKTASPAVSVWRTDAPVIDVHEAIDYAAFTPNAAADGTALYTNRLLLVQTKQMNLQNMLMGREQINAQKARVRAGLLDAVTNLPTGANGAAQSAAGAGGARAMNALVRSATRCEAVFAVNQATTGTVTANVLVFEGSITRQEVGAARAA